jgi:signal transduction histidine kinase/ActR/RegA family two-component response regulator
MSIGGSAMVDRAEANSRRLDDALDRLGAAITGDSEGEALFAVLRESRVVSHRYEERMFGFLRAGDLEAARRVTLEPDFDETIRAFGPPFERLLQIATDHARGAYLRNSSMESYALAASAVAFLIVIGLWTTIALDWFRQTRMASLLNQDLERRVEVRTRQLAEAVEQAEMASRTKSEFLATMSHEVRTPLNGVLGMAQVLASQELTEAQHRNVRTIVESGRLLMSILDDVLDISKVEAGKLEIIPAPFDMRHAMKRIKGLFQSRADEKNVALDVAVDSSVPETLIGDPVRISQCVSNLISNAVKFTERGHVGVGVSAIPLATNRGADCVLVTVSVEDTGIGMNSQAMPLIFEAFNQADSSMARRFGGTGLGLTITRRLARMMGGDVTVASAPNKGSCFTLTFAAAAGRRHGAASEAPAPANLMGGLQGVRILVVDDNSINRQIARLFLEPQNAHVSEAEDGRQALDVLAGQPVDLVLLDIHMPVMDGPEMFKRLRASSAANRNVPVIAVTADAMCGDRERYTRLGMNGYISKPIEQREAIAEITRVLGADMRMAPHSRGGIVGAA